MTPAISAQLAQAAYASLTEGMAGPELSDALQTPSGAFTQTQANRFAATQTVVLQYNDDAAGANGSGTSLSLTVFKDNAGKLTLAIRGTLEPIGDIFPTDANIALRGAGYDQIAALYNWWQRVSHASGQAVAQYRVTEYALSEAPASALLLYSTLNGTSVRAVVLERIADANATGALIPALSADGDGKLDVTGHSLGGHLAMAFAALFPDATASATTFNAPGYSTTSINQQFFATLGAAVPTQANIGGITANVVANHTSAADVSWQGIAMLHSRPGTALDVPIEAQTPPSAEPVKPDALNHSQMVLADALAVYALFDKAQTGLSTTAFNSLLKGAANQEHAGLEGLVGAMRAFMGLGSAALPAGNNQREALYQAIFSISDSATFQSLAGQLLIRPASADLKAAARNDFSAVVALQDLSPIWMSGKNAAADAQLARHWSSTRHTDSAGWIRTGCKHGSTRRRALCPAVRKKKSSVETLLFP